MKKKFMAVLLAATMISVTACGGSSDGANTKEAGSAGSESTASTESKKGAGGYVFKTNGVSVEIDAPMADIQDALGEPLESFESESCAFGDLDKVFTYSGFRIDTYQLDGVDYVLDVVFSDDTVSTTEGVCIGESTAEMKEAYGEPTLEDASQAIYEKGDMKLVFLLDGETIKTIEYLSKKLDS